MASQQRPTPTHPAPLLLPLLLALLLLLPYAFADSSSIEAAPRAKTHRHKRTGRPRIDGGLPGRAGKNGGGGQVGPGMVDMADANGDVSGGMDEAARIAQLTGVDSSAASDAFGTTSASSNATSGAAAGTPTSAAADRKLPGSSKGLPPSDFLFVTSTPAASLQLVTVSRAWRRAIPAVFAADKADSIERTKIDPTQESLVAYPNHKNYPGTDTPHANPGDRRMAMAPLLAAVYSATNLTQKGQAVAAATTAAPCFDKPECYSFKWMLYSANDTAFLVAGLNRMLRNLDHKDPLFLTDQIQCRTPPCHNALCPACRDSVGPDGLPLLGPGGVPYPKCSCTPESQCQQMYPGLTLKECLNSNITTFWSVDTRAGAVISAGWFAAYHRRGLTLRSMKDCVDSSLSGAEGLGKGWREGDGAGAILGSCLKQLALPVQHPEPVPSRPVVKQYFGDAIVVDDFAALLANAMVVMNNRSALVVPPMPAGVERLRYEVTSCHWRNVYGPTCAGWHPSDVARGWTLSSNTVIAAYHLMIMYWGIENDPPAAALGTV